MHFIKDIFEKKETTHAHNKFVRYSKGEFVGPIINIRITKNNIKVNSSFHISDEIIKLLADFIGDKLIHIKGTLSWNKDLSPELAKSGIKYLKVIKSRGIYNYKLDNEIKLKTFIKNLGKYNILISFKTDEYKLTCKPKFPKPSKEISKDFCKLIVPIKHKDIILNEFAFDVKEKDKIKEIEFQHTIYIDEIIFPKDSENLPFEEIRRLSKRKGRLKRKIIINKNTENPTEKEIDFLI